MALLLPAVVVVVIIAFDQPLSLPIGFEGVEIHISKGLTDASDRFDKVVEMRVG